MNPLVLLPLQESMAQCSACKHDKWRGYITILVVGHGIIKSISILTVVIHTMIKFDVDILRECFRQGELWTLAICSQPLTLPGLDLDHVHHLPHALLTEMRLIVSQMGINEFQTLCCGFKAVEIIKLCNVVPYRLNQKGFNHIDLYANLVPV
jgi:hypothetical protein